jgi:hypothetical protein
MAQDFPVRATHRCSLVSGMIVAALERPDGCAAPAPRVLWTVMVDAERRLQHTRRRSAAGFPRRRWSTGAIKVPVRRSATARPGFACRQ